MRRLGFILTVCCLSIMICGSASADVVYTLNSSDAIVPAFSWTVSSPTLLTKFQDFTSFVSTNPPTFSSGTCPIGDVSIDPSTGRVTTNFTANCQSVAEVFGVLDHFGSYNSGPAATLTISETTAVPEPGSLLLLGTGLLGGIRIARRKRRLLA